MSNICFFSSDFICNVSNLSTDIGYDLILQLKVMSENLNQIAQELWGLNIVTYVRQI